MENRRPLAYGRPVDGAPRPRLVAVVQDDCTGCNTCVDYCLVDCIEPVPPAVSPQPSASIHIREDECIGCFVCAKVCEELTVNAIHLIPAEQAEADLDDGNGHRAMRPPLAKAAS